MVIARRLGWQHRGFRAESATKANLGLLLLLALPFAVDQLAFYHRMTDPRFDPDLKGWRDAAAAAVADPAQPLYGYDRGFYIYPPFFLTLIWPLSQVSAAVAGAIFETLKWIALFICLRCAWRLCGPPGEDVPPIVALGSLLATARFLANDMGHGNVNIFLLACILAGCWLLARNRAGGTPAFPGGTAAPSGRRGGLSDETAGSNGHVVPGAMSQVAAGAVVSLAACVKVTPALVLVYFVYKGWWRTLIGAALGAAVCLVLWPALVFGWGDNLRLLGDWYHMVVGSFVERGEVYSIHTNQSLVGIINRLLGPSFAFRDPETHVTITVLPQWGRDLIRYVVAGGAILLLAIVCRRRLPAAPAISRCHTWLAFPAEVSLVLIAMLLLSGLSWKAHFVVMILPYSVLLAYLADGRHAPHARGVAVMTLASLVLCTLTGDVITPTGANYAEAFGLIMLGALVAGAAILRTGLLRSGTVSSTTVGGAPAATS